MINDDEINAALDRFYADPRRLDELAAALRQAAINGNVAAFKEIADRIDGPMPDAVVGDDEHPPVRIVVTWRSQVRPRVARTPESSRERQMPKTAPSIEDGPWLDYQRKTVDRPPWEDYQHKPAPSADGWDQFPLASSRADGWD
jgi:hypothetical protein